MILLRRALKLTVLFKKHFTLNKAVTHRTIEFLPLLPEVTIHTNGVRRSIKSEQRELEDEFES